MEATDSLKSFANDKVGRINKLFHKPTEAHVVLSLERHMHKADVTLNANGLLMRGEDKSEDMYASIDRAVEKIEKQLRRYHGRINNHKARDDSRVKVKLNVLETHEEQPETTTAPEEAATRKVIKTNEFMAKPMSVEEAIMQMDLLHNDFLVFQNSQTHEINVVYRRKDGAFGLIEASHNH